MNEFYAAIIGLISSVVVSVLSIYGAKRLGIGPSQGQLVTTLKDLSSAQDMRIEQLEKDNAEKDVKIQKLENRVSELEQALVKKVLSDSRGTQG